MGLLRSIQLVNWDLPISFCFCCRFIFLVACFFGVFPVFFYVCCWVFFFWVPLGSCLVCGFVCLLSLYPLVFCSVFSMVLALRLLCLSLNPLFSALFCGWRLSLGYAVNLGGSCPRWFPSFVHFESSVFYPVF